MLVKDLMTTKVTTVKPDALVSEVAELLHKHHYSGVPVVNEQNIVLGTISERDFITADSGLYLPTYIRLLSGMDYVQGASRAIPHVVEQIVHSTAKDLMNQKIPFARPDTTLEQLAVMFAESRANPIPVTDNFNKLVGVISRSDLMKFFSPQLIRSSYIPDNRTPQQHVKMRMIDEQVKFTESHFMSTFAYVAKARANIWLTSLIVLSIVGFIAGIIYVADPNIFTDQNEAAKKRFEANKGLNFDVINPPSHSSPAESLNRTNPQGLDDSRLLSPSPQPTLQISTPTPDATQAIEPASGAPTSLTAPSTLTPDTSP